MKIKYPGKIINGELKIVHRKRFDKEISECKDMYVRVTVEKAKKNRSNAQNRYWWGVVIPLVKEGFKDLGHRLDSEETHDFIKHNFCKKDLVNTDTGEIFKTVQGTSKMTTSEFMDLIAVVHQWAAEFLNINIPDPDPNYFNDENSNTQT